MFRQVVFGMFWDVFLNISGKIFNEKEAFIQNNLGIII